MTQNMKTVFIVNPVSGNGASGKRWEALLPLVQEKIKNFECWHTKYHGHATELARKAINEEISLIVAVGGDGILNECTNGFFEKGKLISEKSVLGAFPLGRGNDFVRAMGLLESPDKTLSRFLTNQKKKVDVIRAKLQDKNGNEVIHIVLNNAYIGISEKQEAYSCQTPKFLGSVMSYLIGVLRGALTYKPDTLTITTKNEKETMVINSAVIANGPRFGSGMYPAIKARVDDGLLDISVFKKIAFPFSIDQLVQYYTGNYLNKSWSYYNQSEKVDIRAIQKEVKVNADGDFIGYLPATFEVIPQILNFKV